MSHQPKCPVCGRKGKQAGPDTYRCDFGHFYDSDPNEGSDVYSDPSRRLELQEERELARRENLARRSQASRGFRFSGARR